MVMLELAMLFDALFEELLAGWSCSWINTRGLDECLFNIGRPLYTQEAPMAL